MGSYSAPSACSAMEDEDVVLVAEKQDHSTLQILEVRLSPQFIHSGHGESLGFMYSQLYLKIAVSFV